jgi:hypothetical protein
MTRRILVFTLLFLATTATAQRHRAVRPSAPDCAFSLSHSLGATVVAAGLENGAIQVIASPSTCTSWNAYSLTDWVTVERVNNVVLVDVAPNPASVPRTAVLRIAGLHHELIQDSASSITPPSDPTNLLKNPGLDRDLSFWVFPPQFPNGTGSAAWAPLDAANNPASGSIRLRNTRPPDDTPSFQRLQCVAVESGAIYEYGASFFASSGSAGNAIFALVEYSDDACNAALKKDDHSKNSRTPGSWQTEKFVLRVDAAARSVYIVIGSSVKSPGTFDVYFDDIFLRKR